MSIPLSFLSTFTIIFIVIVKLVYGLPTQILNEYKKAALHSTEKQVYKAQQIAKGWKITLMEI